MTPFDVLHAPLEGTNLIEAGAGTGKTYAIAGLYVRLVVELGLPVDKILVVTYTKAATEELKSRIRKRLYGIRTAFGGGVADDLSTALGACVDAESIRRRIQAALIDFDRAAIFTIHGFCQRVLQHFAFETGQPFTNELIQDQSLLLQETADDFWRRHVSSAPLELAGYVIGRLKGPEQLVDDFNRCRYPDVRILPELKKPRLSAIREWRRIARDVRSQWAASRSTVMELLDTPALNGKFYGVCAPDPQTGLSPRSVFIAALTADMDRWSGGYPLCRHFERWACDFLIKATRKHQVTPQNRFFDLCQQAIETQTLMESQLGEYLRYLKVRFLLQARGQLDRKKERRQVLHFDDLLLQLHQALQNQHGGALSRAVQSQYRGVLVDEFQDTDPLQYDIFTRLFSGGQPLLFMIGDPKQAIYSFRGADVYAYLRAVQSVREPFTLTRNYRSTPALIRAVNTVFGHRPIPFGLERIDYEEAQSAEPDGGEKGPGMVLWHLPMSTAAVVTPPLNRQEAVEKIASAVALEIARLLNDTQRRLAPEAIAVLTRSHRQAQVVKVALSRAKIPAVLHSAGQVFDTPEAGQLYRILQAIIEPADAGRVRAALATDILGATAADFIAPEGAEGAGWESRWVDFMHDHDDWRRSGFYRMFSRLIRREKVKTRLLALDSGERRVTNLLHVAELLHQAESQQRLGPQGLLKWLARQRTADGQGDDTRQLRLESDARAVQIITMHRSKGLQFEVVFCPFTWTGVRENDQFAVFHDPEAQGRLTLALGPGLPPPYRLQTLKEELSEALRMLYVALTRARRRCYWVWGRIKNCEVSAPAYLLHGAGLELRNDWFAAFKSHMATLTDCAWLEDMKALAEASKGAIRLESLPIETGTRRSSTAAAETDLHCRDFTARIQDDWRITSFSSLTLGGHSRDDDMPDRDGDTSKAVLPETTDFSSLFHFPGGTRAGLFFHDLLEHVVFGDPQVEQVAIQKLKSHGYDSQWRTAIARMVEVLGTIELPGSAGMRLVQVSAHQRINELEFYFPLQRIAPNQLGELFDHRMPPSLPQCRQALERLTFAPVEGFLKGFIDMVFEHDGRYYLVDWKSNLLGGHLDAYAPQSLGRIMTESYYFLQYHLYVLALDQLLRRRRPDYDYTHHFGGVYYIFLRGLGRGVNGIFHDRPDVNLIAGMRQALIAI
jgi:exodeoxyribonuclease V beta subunit